MGSPRAKVSEQKIENKSEHKTDNRSEQKPENKPENKLCTLPAGCSDALDHIEGFTRTGAVNGAVGLGLPLFFIGAIPAGIFSILARCFCCTCECISCKWCAGRPPEVDHTFDECPEVCGSFTGMIGAVSGGLIGGTLGCVAGSLSSPIAFFKGSSCHENNKNYTCENYSYEKVKKSMLDDNCCPGEAPRQQRM